MRRASAALLLAALTQASQSPAPAGWTIHTDPASGSPYYVNEADGTTSWTAPEVPGSSPAALSDEPPAYPWEDAAALTAQQQESAAAAARAAAGLGAAAPAGVASDAYEQRYETQPYGYQAEWREGQLVGELGGQAVGEPGGQAAGEPGGQAVGEPGGQAVGELTIAYTFVLQNLLK